MPSVADMARILEPVPGRGTCPLPRIDRQQEALLRVDLVVDLDQDRLGRRVVEADVPALARLELGALLRVAGAEREERAVIEVVLIADRHRPVAADGALEGPRSAAAVRYRPASRNDAVPVDAEVE